MVIILYGLMVGALIGALVGLLVGSAWVLVVLSVAALRMTLTTAVLIPGRRPRPTILRIVAVTLAMALVAFGAAQDMRPHIAWADLTHAIILVAVSVGLCVSRVVGGFATLALVLCASLATKVAYFAIIGPGLRDMATPHVWSWIVGLFGASRWDIAELRYFYNGVLLSSLLDWLCVVLALRFIAGPWSAFLVSGHRSTALPARVMADDD